MNIMYYARIFAAVKAGLLFLLLRGPVGGSGRPKRPTRRQRGKGSGDFNIYISYINDIYTDIYTATIRLVHGHFTTTLRPLHDYFTTTLRPLYNHFTTTLRSLCAYFTTSSRIFSTTDKYLRPLYVYIYTHTK